MWRRLVLRGGNCPGSRMGGSKNRLFNTLAAPNKLVYSGGFENVLTILKRVSIFSCGCTLVGVPLLAFGSSNPRMTAVQKWTVAFVVVLFAVGTTAALNVISKPYVVRMYLCNERRVLKMETLNLVGGLKTTSMDFAHVTPSTKPWATFQSTQNANQRYFVEETKDSYTDEEFYTELWNKLGNPQNQKLKKSDGLF